ncbi:hypothetical protein [Streptomyces sp. MAR4 CNX-425]|uniref:hypothetical protein n=1 Tax=Streptomyces sp. MAR4 CNX-425 TaxID=3406343 RepID=UPI003B5094CE
MPQTEAAAAERGVYEIRILTDTEAEETPGLREPVERLLCPDPDHAPPCEIPWSITLDDDPAALVVGVYATREQATEVTERVRALAGGRRPVSLREGDAGRFEELVEQYEIESGGRGV